MDKQINYGGPAFPLPGMWVEPGMSLRDWFAGQALKGMATDYDGASGIETWNWPNIAKYAYLAADAMLAEREKSNA